MCWSRPSARHMSRMTPPWVTMMWRPVSRSERKAWTRALSSVTDSPPGATNWSKSVSDWRWVGESWFQAAPSSSPKSSSRSRASAPGTSSTETAKPSPSSTRTSPDQDPPHSTSPSPPGHHIPLYNNADAARFGWATPPNRYQRLGLLCDAYGAPLTPALLDDVATWHHMTIATARWADHNPTHPAARPWLKVNINGVEADQHWLRYHAQELLA